MQPEPTTRLTPGTASGTPHALQLLHGAFSHPTGSRPPGLEGPLSKGDDQAPVRERLLALIQAKPAINKSALCKELQVAWGTVSYHIGRLSREGLVQAEPRGRDVLLFARGTSPGLRKSSVVLRESDAHRVLQVLAQRRQASLGELGEALAVSRKVARRLVRMLVAAGLVENVARGRPRYVLSSQERPASMSSRALVVLKATA